MTKALSVPGSGLLAPAVRRRWLPRSAHGVQADRFAGPPCMLSKGKDAGPACGGARRHLRDFRAQGAVGEALECTLDVSILQRLRLIMPSDRARRTSDDQEFSWIPKASSRT